MTPSRFCGTIQRHMKWFVVVAFAAGPTVVVQAQTPAPRSTQTAPPVDRSAEAYAQFMIGHRLAEHDDTAGAITAYKRAMEIDPTAADIPAELASLYLQTDKIQ